MNKKSKVSNFITDKRTIAESYVMKQPLNYKLNDRYTNIKKKFIKIISVETVAWEKIVVNSSSLHIVSVSKWYKLIIILNNASCGNLSIKEKIFLIISSFSLFSLYLNLLKWFNSGISFIFFFMFIKICYFYIISLYDQIIFNK